MSAVVYADIQDPPVNDQGPTRKLSRGVGNMLWCVTEISPTVAAVNEREGNAAAMSYGGIKGFGRTFFRFGSGVFEFATFPFPTYKGSYRPFYKSSTHWIHGGYDEFPPELGFDSKYNYCRAHPSF